MGPSPAKPSEKPMEGLYYGVYFPPDPSNEGTCVSDSDGALVFTDKTEALKRLKQNKKARFKAFHTSTEAMSFAMFGLETGATSPPPDVGEKPTPFRGPKPQDMVRFRKSIEAGDLDFVKKTVWENPRYLVSSGDTPAILQEGSRYNALHIAAKARDAAISAFILEMVGSQEFMWHFYGDTIDVEQRCAVLLDLYLNTPDKALNETPLHFASKFGAAKVVQVLVAYPQCDRTAVNKFQQTAKDVICTRVSGADSGLKEEIAQMLEDQFFVPVLRSPDYSVPPVVGQPFSPTSPLQQEGCGDAQSPVSPVLEVQALAGPMPRQTAELFRRRWKTPPRLPGSPRRHALIDQDKGWEKVGRELAQEWKVPWKEYWPFLDTYIDLNSPEGLQMLEDYLRKRFKSACETSVPDPKSPPTTTITPPTPEGESPISELCSALRACRLSSGSRPRPQPPADDIPANVTSPHLYMDKSCQVFAKRIVDGFRLGDGEVEFLWGEVKHLNVLVSSCKGDNRFSQVDFHRLHSYLGHVVAQKLEAADKPKVLDSLQSLIDRRLEGGYSSDEDDSPNLRRPLSEHRERQILNDGVVCLARAVVTASSRPHSLYQPETEQECSSMWAQANRCSCTFQPNKSSRRKITQKKLNFNDNAISNNCHNYPASSCGKTDKKLILSDDAFIDFNDDAFHGVNAKSCDESVHSGAGAVDSSGEESDTSDTSECEFFTPPSTPGMRSDDDQAMESPDEGPDVYIMGNTPSKLDVAVMEAIRSSELSKVQFPNICRWRHLVMLHSENERQSWCSSPKLKSYCGTPTSRHRSPSLSRSPYF